MWQDPFLALGIPSVVNRVEIAFDWHLYYKLDCSAYCVTVVFVSLQGKKMRTKPEFVGSAYC